VIFPFLQKYASKRHIIGGKMTNDIVDLTKMVLVNTKNLRPWAIKDLTENVAEEIVKLNNYGITAINVFAESNPTYKTQNYSVKIVATAYDKPFVVEKSSEKCVKISDLYSSAQSQLKRDLLQHRDHVKDHRRSYNTK